MKNMLKVSMWIIAVLYIVISIYYQQLDINQKLQEDMNSMYIETNYVFQPYLKAKPVWDKYCWVHQGTTICSDKAYTYEEKEELLK